MTTLTAEQRQELAKAGDEPVRIEDPETHETYVLLKAEVYERIKPPPHDENPSAWQVPEGIRRSKEAFLRDLPDLLTRKRLRGRWVLYHGDKQVGIWRNPQRMLRKALELGLRDDEFYANSISPHLLEPDDEIEHSFLEFEEDEPNP
jgi:hypothetical protein